MSKYGLGERKREIFADGWEAAILDAKGWIERNHLGKGFDGDDRWEHCAAEIVQWLEGQLKRQSEPTTGGEKNGN